MIVFMEIDIQEKIGEIVDMGISWAPKLLLALVALLLGLWIIGRISKIISASLLRSGLEATLGSFLSSLMSIGLKILLFFSIASMVGINTTSFVAILGALMVGIGMALNGTIGHFASGVMLMIFKPFKVGDLVIIGGGQQGTVASINAFNTTLATLDNRRIIVANSNVTSNDIVNISGQEIAGVALTYGIGYGDDIDKARELILEVGKACPTIIDEPAQGVVVGELGDSSVNLNTRPFCRSEHYWDTFFYMQEHVKKAFDKHGINIPYPQMDVHMINPN